MRRSLIEWSETDEHALAAVQGRLQALIPHKTLGRPEVVKLLVRAAAANTTAEALLTAGTRTPRPTCTCKPGYAGSENECRITSPDCAMHGDR